MSYRPIGGPRTTVFADYVGDTRRQHFKDGRLTVGGSSFDVTSSSSNGTRTKLVIDGVIIALAWSPYTLVDDDDYNESEQMLGNLHGDEGEAITELADSRALLTPEDDNVFTPAYITPVFDGGVASTNDDHSSSFQVNLFSIAVADLIAELAIGRQSAGNGADDFWVGYLRSAYQSIPAIDGDPLTSNGVSGGIAPGNVNANTWMSAADVALGGKGLFIFHEGAREHKLFRRNPIGDIQAIVSAHEIGHLFGLDHDDALMNMDKLQTGAPRAFTNKHLNNLRWRVHSPGKF